MTGDQRLTATGSGRSPASYAATWNDVLMVLLLIGAQLLVLPAWWQCRSGGRKHIDTETRIPARVGTTGWDYTKSKNTTLISTPIIGLLIVSSTLAVLDSDAPETIASIGRAIMVMFLAAHWSSVRRAAR